MGSAAGLSEEKLLALEHYADSPLFDLETPGCDRGADAPPSSLSGLLRATQTTRV